MGSGSEAQRSVGGRSRLSKRPNSRGLDKEIREHISSFRRDRRKGNAFIEKHLRDADGQAILNPTAGIAFLLVKVEQERRFVRRYLRSRFGFKVARMGTNPTAGRFLKPERLPSSAGEKVLCFHVMGEWMAREAAFQRMREVIAKRALQPFVDTGEAYRAVREEFRWGLGMVDTFKVGLLLRTSYEDKRLSALILDEESIALFSGWVGAQINLENNKSLNYSLKKESHSPRTKLQEELPAATVIALDNLINEGKLPSKLVNEVTDQLAKAGSSKTREKERDKWRADSDPSDVTTNEPLLQEFLAKEELNALIATLKLSEREGQVLELRLEGHSYREIASALKIGEGDVKTYFFRIRGKWNNQLADKSLRG